MNPHNFTPEAIVDLKGWARRLETKAPRSAHALLLIIYWLDRSVKFVLPDNAALFDRDMDRTPFADMIRPPFPIVAAEYRMVRPDNPNPASFETNTSNRRIALAVELTPRVLRHLRAFVFDWPSALEVLGEVDERMFLMISVFYDEQVHRWGSPPMAKIVYGVHGLEAETGHDAAIADSERNPYMREVIKSRGADVNHVNSSLVSGRFFPLQVEVSDGLFRANGHDRGFAMATLDINDEQWAMVDMCLALNCINTDSRVLPAPKSSLNKKRAAAGKPPLYTYRVLDLLLPGDRRESVNRGGTHASPRAHLRRGHIRRLSDNRITWVRPAMIGASVRGEVEKDYSVRMR